MSLHTLSSFPLTFFFGMAFSVTSRVASLGAVWVEGLLVAANECKVAGTRRELGVAAGGGMDGPAALRSAGVHYSVGKLRAMSRAAM